MGKFSREKGKRFERAIATKLREWFPNSIVRRSSQADHAHESDVVVEGVPIWWECHDSARPAIQQKLDQMEHDAPDGRLPVLVWKKTGDTRIWATLRLDHFLTIFRLFHGALSKIGQEKPTSTEQT